MKIEIRNTKIKTRLITAKIDIMGYQFVKKQKKKKKNKKQKEKQKAKRKTKIKIHKKQK